MKVYTDIKSLKQRIKRDGIQRKTIGFIPTMGALHNGHLSLIQQAREENDIVIVSIFVNPKQFTNESDLEKYPRTIEQDIELVQDSVDYIFAPSTLEMYPSCFQISISVGAHSHDLEGEFRPGHFEGMATVVCKLINICQPTKAYFGLKDYQQFIVVSQMTKDLNIGTKIVGMPTVREASGLAMSSRNSRLSNEEQEISAQIYTILQKAKEMILNGEQNSRDIEQFVVSKLVKLPKCRVEYVAIRSLQLAKIKTIQSDVVILVAVYIGKVRLIDNSIVPRKHAEWCSLKRLNKNQRSEV